MAKYTKDQLKTLVKQYHTYAAIARALGITRQAVYEQCLKHGIQSDIGKMIRNSK